MDETKKCPTMDWIQVRMNGGPPCFHVEGERFCGRAERWDGHPQIHAFVSLNEFVNAAIAHGQEKMSCGHPLACEDEAATVSTSYIGGGGETVVSGCVTCEAIAQARRDLQADVLEFLTGYTGPKHSDEFWGKVLERIIEYENTARREALENAKSLFIGDGIWTAMQARQEFHRLLEGVK